MPSEKRFKKIGITVAVLAAVILAIGIYGSFDPSDPAIGKYFPKCVMKSLTGLDCPSCGLQRSLHLLLKGDFMGAWRCNWFIIFSLSYLLGVVVSINMRQSRPAIYRFFCGPVGAWIYISLYLIWFAARNILHI